jgi:hypothetical protein
MRKTRAQQDCSHRQREFTSVNRRLGLSLALLFLGALPLGCGQNEPSSSNGGSGGSSQATGGASGGSGGGSTAKGGSGGSGNGGASGGSGGSATGGASGGSGGGSGGTGDGGSGGSSKGGAGGTSPGGAGGTSPGGAGGGNPDGGDDSGSAGSCTDKATNGDETDVDCGGATCPKCGAGKICKADTDCKSGKCDAGKCADPFAANATITNTDNIWKITIGTTIVEVDARNTAMVTTFSLDGTNFLVTNSASNGSVFWTAPQSDWNWPPPPEMDNNATYTPTSKDNVLSMVSPSGAKDGLTITKRFWGNVESKVLTLEYTVKNGTTAEIKKAPWEITRVYPGGLTFFPNAETPVVLPGTSNSFLAVPFTTGAGAAWYKYQKSAFTQDIKGGADGLEGWAAHINCGSVLEQACTGIFGTKSMVLIKQWEDTTTQAPSEKEVELYANAGHNYVEFEQQGNYQSIPAGGTMVWTMHWMLRYLPTDVTPTAGSADLVKWVRSQLL